MAYTNTNYPTKKALKEAVSKYNKCTTPWIKEGLGVGVWSPGPYPVADNGTVYIEGPQYPKPHKWYASCTIANGLITTVK